MISRMIRHARYAHSMAVEMRSASKVDSPVSSRELPTDLGTATRSLKGGYKSATSTHGRCGGRTAQRSSGRTMKAMDRR